MPTIKTIDSCPCRHGPVEPHVLQDAESNLPLAVILGPPLSQGQARPEDQPVRGSRVKSTPRVRTTILGSSVPLRRRGPEDDDGEIGMTTE
jgi:hypothetical protein